MERCAHPTDRQRALGRQQQHDQRGLQRDVADGQSVADGHRHERDRQHGEQLHRRRRQERHLEGAHDRNPVLLGNGAHPIDLGVGPAEQSQRRQSDEHVVEVAGQSLQRGPLAVGAVLGELADEDHEHRDQRDRDRQDERGGEVSEQDPCAGGERNDRRQAQRGDVAADPGVERVDAVGDEGRHPCRGGLGCAALVDGERVADDPFGDRPSSSRCGDRRGDLGRPAQRQAGDGDERERPDQWTGGRDIAVDQVGELASDGLCLGQHHDRGHDRQDGADDQMSSQRRCEPEQRGVDRATAGAAWVRVERIHAVDDGSDRFWHPGDARRREPEPPKRAGDVRPGRSGQGCSPDRSAFGRPSSSTPGSR